MLAPTATPESPVCIVDRLTVEVIDGLARKTVVEDIVLRPQAGDLG
jgi:hypothetical protein